MKARRSTDMGSRFRLTFDRTTPGFFRFDEATTTFTLDDALELTLAARDAEKLSQACRFHLEGRGFSDDETALKVGNRLRTRLRVLNSLLGWGLIVPTVDSTSANASPEIKITLFQKSGSVLHDNIVGLGVFPDYENHFELVVSGKGSAHPGEPTYFFSALREVWPLKIQFDERAEDTLEILGRATAEISPRARFLLIYLAAERMIDRPARSKSARTLIKKFQKCVRCSELQAKEAIRCLDLLVA